jgi:hypothetical protein
MCKWFAHHLVEGRRGILLELQDISLALLVPSFLIKPCHIVMPSKLMYSAVVLAAIASIASGSLLTRNNPPQPPCVYPYTKFVYSGCYHDAVFSRALPFQTELEWTNATVEQCTAYCKGNNYRYAGLEYYGELFHMPVLMH